MKQEKETKNTNFAIELPEECHTCDTICLGDCEHYEARESYFSNPETRKRIYDIQQEDFTLHAEEHC